MALATPTRRGRRWVPEKPGVMPKPTSGWPNLAFSEARMISQLIASSQPPPSAKPLTAAMVGNSSFSMRRSSALPRWPQRRPPSRSSGYCSPMSAPATKERPAPVRIMQRTSRSFSSVATTCSSSAITVLFSAFSASARSMVTMAMLSCFSYRTVLPIIFSRPYDTFHAFSITLAVNSLLGS